MNQLTIILSIPFISAGMSYLLGSYNEKIRDAFNVIVTAIVFLLIISLYPKVSATTMEYSISDIMGTGLHLKMDSFRYALVFISGLGWFLGTMFSTQYITRYKNRNRYYLFFMLTYGFTLGVFMADNLLNLFTFFEGMSLTSYALVIHDEDNYSHDAGISYLSMSLAGGLILLMGIFLVFDYTKTLEIGEIGKTIQLLTQVKQYIIAGLFIIGFGIKASMFPLHTWLPKAYASAPAPATAILSAILLKTGLFGVIITLVEILNANLAVSYVVFIIGLINIMLGGIMAIMQRNIKRIIAYSSMSQTGFMLLGIGMIGILGDDGGFALIATLLYMVNHAVFKLLLFMAAGIIYMYFKEMSLNKIWGFGKHKILLKGLFLVGILGIIGFPGFNGFTSKTLIHEAILEAQHLTHYFIFEIAELIFYLGGALTVAYMLKLFIAVFVKENKEFQGQYKLKFRKRALLPLFILASIIIFIGLFPVYFIGLLSGTGQMFNYTLPLEWSFFTRESLMSSFLTMSFGIMIYTLIVQNHLVIKMENQMIYVNPSYKWFSLEDNLYKPIIKSVFKTLSDIFKYLDGWLLSTARLAIKAGSAIGSFDVKVLPKLEWDRYTIDLEPNKIRENIKEKVTESKETIQNSVSDKFNGESLKMKDIIESYKIKLSGITFSIFLLGIVIVLSYIFIFIKK
ncbi:MAG: hypothetical protein JW702_05800 [Clostridiales bacterium]|nr:hypothetical protein [Clostridiales bacterium]